MEGNHKIKSFDYDIKTIKQKLAEREISEKHGDFVELLSGRQSKSKVDRIKRASRRHHKIPTFTST